MDFNKPITRYRQFGGIRLVVEYAKLGVLWPAIKAGVRCVVKRQSFKTIYPAVLQLVEPFLIEKYAPVASRFKFQGSSDYECKRSKIVWFCWLQGLDQAPPIVKACYNSLKHNLSDRKIKVIDNENWKEYVELPDNIVKKWEKKRIPAALFSDLLRLELLIKYGGTWIDSTVLCSGFQDSCSRFQEYLDAELFLFQYTPEGTTKDISISNWFISAHSNNEVLMTLRNMLFAYWKDYGCTLDYYIFHLFFSTVAKEYPEEIAVMPYGYSMRSLTLLHHWGETFEQKNWDKLISKVCFHKLAFRNDQKIINNKENYYNHILSIYN